MARFTRAELALSDARSARAELELSDAHHRAELALSGADSSTGPGCHRLTRALHRPELGSLDDGCHRGARSWAELARGIGAFLTRPLGDLEGCRRVHRGVR
ncbi:hypothetical protein POL68_25075 [Stigmatella sp. ncwal1]|uniref:Uncharacterized protein n=1 Tax=Stigmatella ashevillensis TaxID=2995309 RepID=A0ABT5DHC5_9BACT|nr:hypothetical protein [Stigmatella ashevillena]MDC0711766.1 hypothetical protein [Stigmatella ashevillena]